MRLQKDEGMLETDKGNIEEKARVEERVEKGGVMLKDDVDVAHPEKVTMETQDFVLFHRSFFRLAKTGN